MRVPGPNSNHQKDRAIVDWVVLTNGTHWRIYNVLFGKPIGQELVIDIEVCALNPKSATDLELLYLFCKEGWVKSVLGEYQLRRQALSRFFLGALVLSDSVLEVIRRELRRVSPEVKIETEQVKAVLSTEVLKREVIDGEKFDEARKKIARAANKALRKTQAAPALPTAGGEAEVGQKSTSTAML